MARGPHNTRRQIMRFPFSKREPEAQSKIARPGLPVGGGDASLPAPSHLWLLRAPPHPRAPRTMLTFKRAFQCHGNQRSLEGDLSLNSSFSQLSPTPNTKYQMSWGTKRARVGVWVCGWVQGRKDLSSLIAPSSFPTKYHPFSQPREEGS